MHTYVVTFQKISPKKKNMKKKPTISKTSKIFEIKHQLKRRMTGTTEYLTIDACHIILPVEPSQTTLYELRRIYIYIYIQSLTFQGVTTTKIRSPGSPVGARFLNEIQRLRFENGNRADEVG